MNTKKKLAYTWAAMSALALGGSMWSTAPAMADTETTAAEVEGPKDWSLTDAMGETETLNANHLKVYGWFEGGYTYNANNPHDRINNLRSFDVRSNAFVLNQLTVNLEKTLKDGNEFDWGGKVEVLFGGDARFTHQRGLFDNINGDSNDPTSNSDTPHDPVKGNVYTLDLTQFYAQARLPIGNGIVLQGGRFYTPIGYETTDAVANVFYSHSFLYGFSEPISHTGGMATYTINDQWSAYGGVVLGWDVWEDPNNTLSIMGGGTYAPSKQMNFTLNVISGPERFVGAKPAPGARNTLINENTDYRTLFDFVAHYSLNDYWSFGLNVDFANESGDGFATATGNNWYGFAGYAQYVICKDIINANFRAEYFVDETGSRMGFTSQIMELTAGLDIHPIKQFHNLRVRPEIRWDHAFGTDFPYDTGAPNGHAGGGNDNNQVTLGVDVIITY